MWHNALLNAYERATPTASKNTASGNPLSNTHV
jgi:hypothetical protein